MGIFSKIFGTSETPSGATVQQLISQAENAIIEGRTQDGVELLRKALHVKPDDPKVTDSIYNLAFALHGGAAQQNKKAGGNHLYFSAGFPELHSAISIIELLTVPPYERADVWFQLGIFLDHSCQFDRAIKAYRRAIELEPDGPDACDSLNNLGILYTRGCGSLGVKNTSSGGMVGLTRKAQTSTKQRKPFYKLSMLVKKQLLKIQIAKIHYSIPTVLLGKYIPTVFKALKLSNIVYSYII